MMTDVKRVEERGGWRGMPGCVRERDLSAARIFTRMASTRWTPSRSVPRTMARCEWDMRAGQKRTHLEVRYRT